MVIFNNYLSFLSITAITEYKILCSMDQISQLRRLVDVPDTGLLCNLLWSDESQIKQIDDWDNSGESVCYTFSCHGVSIVLK